MPLSLPRETGGPVRLAIVTDEDVVYRGLSSVVVEMGAPTQLLGRTVDLTADPGVDVVLYDVARLSSGSADELEWLVKESHAAVVAIARDLRPDLASHALEKGVDGVISMSAGAEEIIRAIEAAAAGDLAGDNSPEAADYTGNPSRLGVAEGLSPREVEVMGLITQGLGNDDIARRLYLSINSVKTYIRSAYRKTGVTSRSQAIAWAVQHGFALDDVRDAPAQGTDES
ncbi:response regulator transcription factor [Nocardioides sp. cx-173]|uniref:helix-turn-helix domain-containing protein n=1 Tax=Nocardioides sp. cx-173 TaxID=2898796 RepID=UPI001E29A702|nr:response regulator transcription factor [Nocardioides sp. cx-173]MCD4525114.1 response regulator transcription factor [Nocardioides sp. cx-173]UGB40183.1 response regulator transcription factor [Nocardioides sp. cx-173]